MEKVALFGVGELPEPVVIESKKVIEEKFPLEPLFLGELQPEFRSKRDGQLLAEVQLEKLLSLKPEGFLFAGGITPYDLYSNGLNFVFGLALPFNGFIVSYSRLLTKDFELFRSRLKKEITHEMGHVFGLSHCPLPECVMHFSNSLFEVDFKGEDFCRRCRKELERAFLKLNLL
ncbi:archaemetzincin family Zn-dependent metalloprotease [Thermovibrio sp.]